MKEKKAAAPKNAECQDAFLVLSIARKTAASFLNTFQTSRRNRKAKGTSTDAEQDMLRAMLVLSAAGLDALLKQLVRDALPKVIQTNEGSHEAFVEYIERQILRDQKDSARFLAFALSTKNPKLDLISQYVRALCADSLQSSDQVFRVAACFDIPTPEFCAAPKNLKDTFKVRNEIVHEMDINFEPKNRSRRPRKREDLERHTNVLFDIGEKIISAVDKRLSTAS